ncbi:hypothetical protein A1A1_00858 [Planococcus antarcticus DSM 14505]|uniref:Uncharacterized protein n=1 Tax=Planococcus antarcticus DSM 14505 TaxID=1185653 RepID=A0AA87IQG0_9BACL|nr:permease prefix domain 1-containing protein [Planococcus antarcticus]EIM08422.1 hypothetical protein A1A1_00858 [Planococcus antarcticus DSM 14505]
MKSNISIEDYLNSLAKKLNDIPKSEQQTIIEEIRDHLEGEVQTQMESGKSRSLAESSVLEEFKSPEKLSEDYFQTYEEADPKPVTFSLILMSFWTMGAAFLMIPILTGSVDTARFVIGLGMAIFAMIYLFLKKNWRRSEIKMFKAIPGAIPFLLLPLSLLLFWINGNIGSFLIIYTVSYWIYLLLSRVFFSYLSQKKGFGKISINDISLKK